MTPVFILCAMRSYSSLICAMVGQHPDLYGLPEINLSVGDSVSDVQAFYANRPHGMHGLIRVVAELEFGGQTPETVEQAKAWIDQRKGWSSAQMLGWIEEAVAPRRIVDKSPVTVRSVDMMHRLHRMRPEAQFLHIIRQPAAVAKSIDRLHEEIDRQNGSNLRGRVNAENVWLRSNTNVLEFKEQMPPGVCLTLQGELFLGEYENYARQLCEWLDIRDDDDALDAMLHPETSPYACMGPEGAEYGNDPNFLNNAVFKRRPIKVEPVDNGIDGKPFNRRTRKLAREMGYA